MRFDGRRLLAWPAALWRRGGVELGIVAVAAALLLGAVVGTGAASTYARVADGLTWIGDDSDGQIVQIDPATGKPQNRLQVAGEGADLDISQTDDNLVVTDSRTGQVTAIDLATLLASGRRSGSPDGKTKVLVGGGRMVVADLGTGVVHRVDPLTMDDIGAPLSLGPLADAVMDAAGVLWTAGEDTHARSARWSDEAGRFVLEEDRTVSGSGPGSALVPHDAGVTLFGPAGGVAVQIGTSGDVAAAVPEIQGPVLAAEDSPSDVVPVTVTDSGTLVILADGRAVRVAMAGMGCAQPGRPTVFGGDVYVPCLGAGKVVVLGRDGRRSGPDVQTAGGGDPKLVVDDGRMVVTTPGADKAVVVGSDGSTTPVQVRDPKAPVRDPGAVPVPPTVPPLPTVLQTTTTPPPASSQQQPPQTTGSTTPRTSGAPGPSGTAPGGTTGNPAPGGAGTGGGGGAPAGGGEAPGGGTPVVTLDAPTGVAAQVLSTGSVLVTWTPGASGADGFTISRSGGGGATTAGGGERSATVSGLPNGTFTFTVAATRGGATARSAPSAPVTVGSAAPVSTTSAPTPTYIPPAPPTTVAPPPATTVAPPPVTTTVAPPPVTTTVAPPPTTTVAPVPQPAAGDAVITSVYGYGQSGRGQLGRAPVEVSLNPPGPWASWAGGCQLVYSGMITGTQDVACSATYATLPSSRAGDVTVYVQAVGGPASASVTGTVEIEPVDPCTGVPYLAPASYQPGGLAPQIPIDPTCQPAAYELTPPAGPGDGGGPNQVVWAVGLLGAAALVRILRTGSVRPGSRERHGR